MFALAGIVFSLSDGRAVAQRGKAFLGQGYIRYFFLAWVCIYSNQKYRRAAVSPQYGFLSSAH
jgi:hypothetical protein